MTLKAGFVALCLLGLALACEACAWLPWWGAGPACVLLGASLEWCGTRVHDKLLQIERCYRRSLEFRPQRRPPRAQERRFTYRMKL